MKKKGLEQTVVEQKKTSPKLSTPYFFGHDKIPDWNTNNVTFQEIVNECRDEELEKNQDIESLLISFSNRAAQALLELELYREFLRTIPISVAILDWAHGLVKDEFWSERYLPLMLKLQREGVIPTKDEQGKPVFLDYLMQRGHQEILENIRCIDGWSIFEKEEIVQCYVQFTHSLSRRTLGTIAHGFDPDRERLRFKAIRYNDFIDFVQHLSGRDALIAKLLYFGAPSLDEILYLKRGQISTTAFSVQFAKGAVCFPRHLIRDLLAYEAKNTKSKDLLFTNMRGALVERAHLNQSFARGCEKMSKVIKITPGSLLKLENEA